MLLSAICIMEQVFIGSTVALDGFSIGGPVKIGHKRVMTFADTFFVVFITLNVEDVDFVVVGPNSQFTVVWGVPHDFDPFLGDLFLPDNVV